MFQQLPMLVLQMFRKCLGPDSLSNIWHNLWIQCPEISGESFIFVSETENPQWLPTLGGQFVRWPVPIAAYASF